MTIPDKKSALLLKMLHAALKAIDPARLIAQSVSLKGEILTFKGLNLPSFALDLNRYSRIRIIGAGKAVVPMSCALLDILGERVEDGQIISPNHSSVPLKPIKHTQGSHPIPDSQSVSGARGIVKLCRSAGEGELIISLLSGGASALLCYPAESMSLGKLQDINEALIRSGADITEINTVRSAISRVKGGKLAGMVYPAECVNLIISDVIGDNLQFIGSGPLVRPKERMNAAQIIDKYDLNKLFKGYEVLYKANLSDPMNEKVFKNIKNILIANNLLALNAAAAAAESSGVAAQILSNRLSGEACIQGQNFAAVSRSIRPGTGRALITGGETTVTVRGNGFGGRNQEMVLAFAINAPINDSIAFLSAGTDGIDGRSLDAGAMVHRAQIELIQESSDEARNALQNNDSNTFLKTVNATLNTGPTGTNVGDIQVLLT